MDMAEAVHLNSLDEDNRRFVPGEVNAQISATGPDSILKYLRTKPFIHGHL